MVVQRREVSKRRDSLSSVIRAEEDGALALLFVILGEKESRDLVRRWRDVEESVSVPSSSLQAEGRE